MMSSTQDAITQDVINTGRHQHRTSLTQDVIDTGRHQHRTSSTKMMFKNVVSPRQVISQRRESRNQFFPSNPFVKKFVVRSNENYNYYCCNYIIHSRKLMAEKYI